MIYNGVKKISKSSILFFSLALGLLFFNVSSGSAATFFSCDGSSFCGAGPANYKGTLTIGSQSDSPTGNSGVWKWTYPDANDYDGSGIASIWVTGDAGKDLWIQYYWKYSSNFQYYPGANNKQMYFHPQNTMNVGINPSYGINMMPQGGGIGNFPPNVDTSLGYIYPTGIWHKLKAHYVMNSADGVRDGKYEAWVDDKKIASYTNVWYSDTGTNGMNFHDVGWVVIYGGRCNGVSGSANCSISAEQYFYTAGMYVGNSDPGGGSYTPPPTPSQFCGDQSCNNGETCSTCSRDCGACSVTPPSTQKYTLTDFTNLVTDWLKSISNSPGDVNLDSKVNTRDLGIMMSNWQTATPNPTGNLTVRAKGVVGDETIDLKVNDNTIQTWTLTTSYQDYSTSANISNSDDVRVYFTNDAGDRDVQIDYATINGTTYQAENQTTNTGGWNFDTAACGGAQSEWLHCNGYIEFRTSGSITCTPNWSCAAWSVCSGNQQTRSCSDSKNCGTTSGKPATSQTCTVSASCGDGTCNGAETCSTCSQDCGSCGVGWTLNWSEEFDYTGAPDTSRWIYENGYVRNNEMQYYTSRPENVRVENGNLVLEARNDNYQGHAVTAGSIKTVGKKYVGPYGRLETRAKLPKGKGTWPAIWQMGESYTQGSDGWPTAGEIDIMEYWPGLRPSIQQTVHFGPDSGAGHIQVYKQTNIGDPSTDYHIYAVEKYSDRIDFFIDSTKTYTYYKSSNPSKWPYDQRADIRLNYAFGGDFNPVDLGILPQKFYIDYVRYYTKN